MTEGSKNYFFRTKGLIRLSLIALTAFVFTLPAVFNGFPLINSDSGAYLQAANDFFALVDRPMFYGYFIHYFSFGNSLWTVIIIQNLILAWTLHLAFRTFQAYYKTVHLLIGALLITLTTCVAWFSCQIMTDIFTGLSILSLTILITNNHLRWFETILLSILFFISTVFHLSHLPMNTLIVLSLILISIAGKKKYRFYRLPLLTMLLVLSWISIPYKNLKSFNSYTMAYAGDVLFTGRLMETGLLQKYLNEHCVTDHYKLCDFKDQFPPYVAAFIWNYPASIVDKMGGFDSCKKEFGTINRGVLGEYSIQFITISALASFRNLVTLSIGPGLYGYDDRSSPSMRINKYYPSSWDSYQHSKQQQGQLNFFPLLNFLQYLVVILSCIYLLFRFFNKKKSELGVQQINFLLVLIFALLFNAIITGTLASEQDTRYESRIIWLVPIFVMMIVTDASSKREKPEVNYQM